MARCNNGANGLDGRIHYSGELAALQAEKREDHGIESPDFNIERALPARRQFEGLTSTTQRPKLRNPLEHGRQGESIPLIREAWRHCWPVINTSRDKNPQLEHQDDDNQSRKILWVVMQKTPLKKLSSNSN
jgi:hypothetical protein